MPKNRATKRNEAKKKCKNERELQNVKSHIQQYIKPHRISTRYRRLSKAKIMCL